MTIWDVAISVMSALVIVAAFVALYLAAKVDGMDDDGWD